MTTVYTQDPQLLEYGIVIEQLISDQLKAQTCACGCACVWAACGGDEFGMRKPSCQNQVQERSRPVMWRTAETEDPNDHETLVRHLRPSNEQCDGGLDSEG